MTRADLEPGLAQPVPSEPRWLACFHEDLVVASWDDGFAVFHRPSGQTHFVNETTVSLLFDVLTKPATLHDIAGRFADGTDRESRHQLEQGLLRVLLRLEGLGLVRRLVQ